MEELQNTKEFKKMRKTKGRQIENWNWQSHDSKYGAPTQIGSDYEILSHYEPSDGSYPAAKEELQMLKKRVPMRTKKYDQ